MDIRFEKYFSLDDFKAIQETFKNETQAGIDLYSKTVEERFQPALKRFLEAKRDAGQLSAIPNGGGHSIEIIRLWNGLVDNTKEFNRNRYAWPFLLGNFNSEFMFEPLYALEDAGVTPEGIQEAYRAVVDSVTQGNTPVHRNTSDHYCGNDNISYRHTMINWQITLMGFDMKAKKFKPLQPIEGPKIVEVSIDFKTGNLLIADWFRIEEFTQLVKASQTSISVNSSQGREQQTQKYIDDFNMVSVSCGNSAPGLYWQDGALVVGFHNDEYTDAEDSGVEEYKPCPLPEGMKEIGQVCCDLWWTTIIEKENLVEIIARSLAQKDLEDPNTLKERSETILADYIEEKVPNGYLNEIKIPPGQYWLYQYQGEEDFYEVFESPDLPLHPSMETKFVLSSRRLEFVDKRDPKPEALRL